MVTEDQIVEIPITAKEYALAYRNAEAAWFNGSSRVVKDRKKREEDGFEHQFTGQIGELAGHKFLFRTIAGYVKNRKARNADRFKGDNGSDVEGELIDFKASRWRDPNNRKLITYHLIVRPEERHAGSVYVLVMVRWRPRKEYAHAYIIGWATDDMLPDQPEPDDTSDFGGAYALPGHALHPPETLLEEPL